MNLGRGFLAVPVPSQIQRAVAELQVQLSSRLENLRWVHPDSVHLTLHFFGVIREENLEKIKVSMLSVAIGTEPFQVDIQKLGVFPNVHRPRVLWLGVNPQEPLLALHGAWRTALEQAGLHPEGGVFSPHLTIGRFRRRGNSLETLLADQAGISRLGLLPIDRLVLYESHLTPRRAKHVPVHSVRLGRTSS